MFIDFRERESGVEGERERLISCLSYALLLAIEHAT